MPVTIRSRVRPLIVFVTVVLFGCADQPVLIPKSAAVPTGIDLSGNWRIRGGPGALNLPGTGKGAEPIIRADNARRRKSSRSSAMSAGVFLESGESLKITQTLYGMFISYDRSIVEEYTFGENRLVSIGPIEAQRVSGWDANTFVVETLDRDGTTLLESWQLRNDAVLVRDIRMSKRENETFSAQQVFDRI